MGKTFEGDSMILDKEITEDLMSDFATWLWRTEFKRSEAEIDDFFERRGITCHDAIASADYHGIVLIAATFEEDQPVSSLTKLRKWLWK
jgi:hypothetical protein